VIWQAAGILGIDPGPRTLRELVVMLDGRRREQWNHTASLMALLASVHRDPKKRRSGYSPQEFHPLEQASAGGGGGRGRGIPLTRGTIGALKVLLSPQKLRELEARQLAKRIQASGGRQAAGVSSGEKAT
jgi:hypothetical protein